MMRKATTLAALVSTFFLLTVSESRGQRTWEVGTEGEIDGMSYRYYLPANYDDSIKYPLVMFLHGSGESGTDNSKQVRIFVSGLVSKTESEYPAIFVAPQLPSSVGWSPFQPIDHTGEILTQLVDTLSVDTDRLYLTGLSMGGFGSMEYAQRYNAEGLNDLQFAAVAPLSGAFIDTDRPGVPENLLDTPIWMFHGSNDRTVDPDTSRDTFRVLAGLGSSDPIPFNETLLGGPTAIHGETHYTEIIGRGHNIWSPIYKNNAFYDWMFAQSTAIPEPSTLLLAVISSTAFLLRPLRTSSIHRRAQREDP